MISKGGAPLPSRSMSSILHLHPMPTCAPHPPKSRHHNRSINDIGGNCPHLQALGMPKLAEQYSLQKPGLGWGGVGAGVGGGRAISPAPLPLLHPYAAAPLTVPRDHPSSPAPSEAPPPRGGTTSRDTPTSPLAPVRLLGNVHWAVTSHREAGPRRAAHQWRGRGRPLLLQRLVSWAPALHPSPPWRQAPQPRGGGSHFKK